MTKTHWSTEKLRDHISVLTDYHANGSYEKLKANVELLDEPNYAVMIRTTNFEKYDFVDNLKFITKHAYEFLQKSKVYPNDILMNKIANAGSVYLMPDLKRPVSLAMNLFLIRTKPETTNQKFIFYYLKANESYIKGFAAGTASPTITKESVRNLDIKLPSLAIQNRIAEILSAYYDQIGNNTRRIRILEEMAKTIYQERFGKVDVNSLPSGWEFQPLGNISTVLLGGTPSRNRAEFWNGGNIPWIKSGKLNDIRVVESTEFITNLGLENSSAKLMPPKTVLIAITGEILVSMLEISSCANQSVVGVYDSKYLSQEYLHLYLKDKIQDLKNKMSGSAQQHINKEIVMDTPILLPPFALMNDFNKHVKPIYLLVANLLKRNANLRRTRDFLLPRLVNGEIDVSSLS